MTDALSTDDLKTYRQRLEAVKDELQSILDTTEENENPPRSIPPSGA